MASMKWSWQFVGLSLLALLLTAAQELVSGRLVPFRKGTKWGYADHSRRLVLPLQYEEAGPFVEEVAWVRQNGLYGYIDGGGNPITPVHFTKASTFYKGRATVELQGETFDIDATGRRLTTPPEPAPEEDYLSLGDLVRQQGKVGFRFTVGSAVVPAEYDEIREDYRQLLFVRQGNKWGVLNRKGKLTLPLQLDTIVATPQNDFRFPIARQQGRYGYLNAEGRWLVAPKYRLAEPFIGDVARVETPDGRTGYIDSSGKEFFE
ncbi:WG repeat-containing protein [Hymenobacter sp. BT18]|nr:MULTISPECIES: WG repeat-containing protein [Hymenobacter]QIX61297.1 WG repeat-containing protein [Hymenobacter sp. BT18]